jgi:hypothetical protein
VTLAARLWHRLETIHAVTYFASESREAMHDLGLRGFWMGYFAGRAAPMGAVSAPVVTATFFNFHPEMVARSIPDAWSYASPDSVLVARRAAAAAALRRILPDLERQLGDSLDLLARAVVTSSGEGRPLYAANREVAVADTDPVGELWQLATALREHRGDSHVALLTSRGLDGCQAHVLAAAFKGIPVETLRENRGWTHDDWTAAERSLRERGWLDAGGRLTDEGRHARIEIERRTDELAMQPYLAIGDDAHCLADSLGPIRDAIRASGTIPYPNPMGLPAHLDGDD